MSGQPACRILRSVEEVEAERAAWDRIVDEECGGNPFLSADWMLAWLRRFARDAEIHFARIAEGERPVAYFPMVIRRRKYHGIPARMLTYAGNVYSPVNCPIVAAGWAKRAAACFVTEVLPKLSWDFIEAYDLPVELPGLAELAEELERAGYRVSPADGEGNWIYRDGAATAEDYFAGLKYNIRNDTRRFPRKLAELGELRFAMVGAEFAEADALVYKQVYEKSWKEPELAPEFHPELMAVAARGGWLRLGFLYLNERPIAAQLWFLRNGWGYVVKTAYDEEFRAFSTGTILTWRVIERLMQADGMRAFDFLKGDDGYKKYWTNARRERRVLTAYQRNIRGRVLCALDRKILPAVRRSRALSALKRMLTGSPRA